MDSTPKNHNSAFCPTCHCFRDGTIQYVTSSHRKLHYNFLCNFCLIPSEGYVILKKDKKKKP